eukprot:6210761-Pleurochrysis_carterae.AAC.3
MPLVGGADLNGTASGDPTDLRFNRPCRASPTGLYVGYALRPDQMHVTSSYVLRLPRKTHEAI